MGSSAVRDIIEVRDRVWADAARAGTIWMNGVFLPPSTIAPKDDETTCALGRKSNRFERRRAAALARRRP